MTTVAFVVKIKGLKHDKNEGFHVTNPFSHDWAADEEPSPIDMDNYAQDTYSLKKAEPPLVIAGQSSQENSELEIVWGNSNRPRSLLNLERSGPSIRSTSDHDGKGGA